MKLKVLSVCVLLTLMSSVAWASKLFIPMDSVGQANHLKAYGVAFAAMQQGIKVDWLLNYKGGSFAMDNDKDLEQLCKDRGVSFTKMSNKQYAQITKKIADPAFNGAVVTLERAPKIAVYTPPNKEPWDDAVTLALTYAQIPFDKLYADEVLAGNLDKYDWLHLHHEDFTGQYGKFWGQFRDADWYKHDQQTMEAIAAKNGYKKVSQLQLAVVKKIKQFVADGGNLFAMCSATETFDIALAAEGTDICDEPFDGDPIAPDAQSKLDFSKCFAFKDFSIIKNPYVYTRSNIDNTLYRKAVAGNDYFTLLPAPAKFDQVSSMLCQDHTNVIRGFMGQTTAFRQDVIKPGVTILGDRFQAAEKQTQDAAGSKSSVYLQDYEARYIHGTFEKGSWTFYSGHDPEAYEHHIGDPVTDLGKYPNSPGYRIILNNVLFPAAKKTVVPTVVMNSDTSNAKPTAPQNAVNNVIQAAGIKIYPNPANGELIISLSSDKIEQVVITNISGQEVFNHSYNISMVSVDMNNLTPGMYLIKVNGQYAGRVVKE